MKITPLAIKDVLLIEPKRFTDDRGFFSEVYNSRTFAEAGLRFNWVQDNHAMSLQKGTLRGLHFQSPPHAQSKLVHVTRGSVFDVAADLRAGSPTFGQWVSVVLSAGEWNQLLVPVGFAHGYLTLEPNTGVYYKVDDHYASQSDAGVIWNDPHLAIDWPLDRLEPILSDKDRKLPRLSELQISFQFHG
jgi:dTDP-4-dehydrorhamnose 3,5-epimerase